MRKCLVAACFALALNAFAAEPVLRFGESNPPPKTGFASPAELKKWAETSSFGGGFMNAHDLGGVRGYVVIRSFTSGVESSEVWVYSQPTPEGALTLKWHLPLRRVSMRSRLLGEAILIERYDERQRDWVVEFTIRVNPFRIEPVPPFTIKPFSGHDHSWGSFASPPRVPMR